MQQMGKGRVTIYDIARTANVSVSTVSRALNGSTLVTDRCRSLVNETARQMGYQRRRIMRPTGRSILNVLVVLPRAASPPAHLFYDATALFEGLVAGFGDSAVHTIAVPAGSTRPLDSKKLGDIDGCVFAFSDPSAGFVRRLASRRVPSIYINRQRPGQSCVVNDASAGMRALADLAVLHHGSGPVCFLGLDDASAVGEVRLRALQAARRGHHGGPVDSRWFPTASSLATADVQLLVSAGYRVLFAMNDLLAVAVLDRLLRIGVEVPKQIAVAGYDAAPVGRLVGTRLTTVDLAVRQMAVAAGTRLAEHIARRESEPGVISIQGELIRGETL